jgi:pimeloyl-ACP methyl ester carboxylesterase/AcrR family transcriptional regulator
MVTCEEREKRNDAQIVRRFSAGDDSVMREKLTYLSHSDRTLSYIMLEGIANADHYSATVSVTPNDTASGTGSTITWQASIDAEPTAANAIALGTAAVFEAAFTVLESPALEVPVVGHVPKQTKLAPAKTKSVTLGESRQLGLTVTSQNLESTETLCIFLHGIGGNRKNWDSQLEALGSLVPMVSMDIRGYGDSTLGSAQSCIDDYANDVLDVMAHFGAKKLVLCGLSYGAWIAASIALRYPEKMAGLILCGGCTGMSEAAPEVREAFLTSREVPLDAGQTPADFAPAVVDLIAGPNATKAMRLALHESMAAIAPDTYRDALNCFCNPLEKLDFSAANSPVLLMTGEHDKLAPPAEIRAVSHRFAEAGAPFVNFEVIEDAGHVCNVEQPAAVNAHISRFLDMLNLKQKRSPKTAKKSEKRARILAAALSEFSKNGFSGASMQSIATRAKVSKPTLYQYIGQKDAIFRAVLEQGRETILAPFERTAGKDLVTVLWDFSWAYADYVLHRDNLSIARLIIGEAERVPDIARQFHETGPAQAQAGIAAFLDQQRDEGLLAFDEPQLAAEHLWSLILSGPRNHALHFPNDLQSKDTIEISIFTGLQVFLRAYSAKPNEHLAQLEVARATWR